MMPETNKQLEVTPTEKNAIEVIAELKAKLESSISKAEYDKVIAENKTILNDYVNKLPAPPVTELVSAKEYGTKLRSGKEMSNREFIETSVNFREATLKETGRDPWSDNGQETEDTKKVAETFKELLQTNPDDFSFRVKLQEVMRDDVTALARLRAMKDEESKGSKGKKKS